jgi:glyoxylate/hydroxypyruvate reductase A
LFATGAGIDRLLASEIVPATLPIIRLEDAGMGAQMTTYCISETLGWMRHVESYAAQQRAGVWKQLPAEEPAAWPIGIFGLGVLGRRVAEGFAALGFTVNAYTRSRLSDARFRCFCEADGPEAFNAFLKATRVLILLAPLTAATQDRFDRAALAQLPKGAYVINVARGGLLVEDALLEQLDNGRLAGAALDVFREEPLPPSHPLWTHPKIRVTPHISALTLIEPSTQQIADKIRRLERGEPVGGAVDRKRGY